MRTGITFLILTFILSCSQMLDIEAIPIEDIGVGGGGTTDSCGDYYNDSITVSLNSVTNCDLSSTSDDDWFRFSVPNNTSITIYTTGSTDVKMYIYDSPDYATPILSNDNTLAQTTGSYFTTYENSYIELLGEAGHWYYVKIESSSNDTGAFSFVVDDCQCENDVSLAVFNMIYGSAVSNDELEVFFDTDFGTHIYYAIDQWNALGNQVNIHRTYSILDSDVAVIDIWETNSNSFNFANMYVLPYLSTPPKISLNVYILEEYSDNQIDKTLMHEMGHALGISLDDTIVNINLVVFPLIYSDLIESESNLNVMKYQTSDQPLYTRYELGPCDRAMYYYIFD